MNRFERKILFAIGLSVFLALGGAVFLAQGALREVYSVSFREYCETVTRVRVHPHE